MPRFVKLADPTTAMKYEDPISLSILYQPVTVKGSDPKHSYSRPIIDELTKTSKIDPLTETVLESDWRIEDLSLDNELSQVMGCLSLTNGREYTAELSLNLDKIR